MKISVVIPVFNSAGIQKELYYRLVDVLENYNPEFEVIYVNDGSQDDSFKVLKKICLQDKRMKLIDFTRNFGHQAAISAGLEKATGDVVAIIDDDLQDPPELLPKFISKLSDGYEVVYGIRKKRKENIFKRLGFYFFYRLLGLLTKNNIPYDSGDFCVIKRRAVNEINRFQESNRFLRGIRSWIGFKQTGIEYERDARYAGKSQYTIRKYFRFAFNAIFSFSYVPLRVSTFVGLSIAGVSFIYGFIVILKKLLGRIDQVPGFAATFVALTFIGGLILLSLGIIGEYIARMYDEMKRRPHFIIKEKIGFE